MAGFQNNVNLYNPIGVLGELAYASPTRVQPFNLNSSGKAQFIAYAYTYTDGGNPNPPANSPNAQSAQVGGSGVFAGILVSPKEYASYGNVTDGPLGPSIVLPDNAIGQLMQMGYCFVNLPGPAVPGDLVTYDPLTGALNSVTPQAQFTGSIATGVLTVTAVAKGQLQVGQQISGASIPAGTYITAFDTGNGFTGTYATNNTSFAASSEAMTAQSLPATAASFTGAIATSGGVDTLTVSAVASGHLQIGMQIFGTGIAPNTIIASLGTGTGAAGTYVLNSSGQTVASEAMTGPANLFVPHCVVDTWDTNSGGGLAIIKLTN